MFGRRRFAAPETHYLTNDGVTIGYQIAGEGPLDVVVSPPLVSNIDLSWQWPWFNTVYRRLATRRRLIIFDKRGMGTSDRNAEPAALEPALEDMRAVMDTAGVSRAVILGISEGTPLTMLFAATYPARTAGLVVFGGFARWSQAPDYPWGRPAESGAQSLNTMRHIFDGPRDEAAGLVGSIGNLSLKDRRRFVDNVRASADWPTTKTSILLTRQVDIRHALPSIDTPTLLLHGTADPQVPLGAARYLAEQIDGSTLLEVPGEKHLPTGKALEHVLNEIDRFLDGIETSTTV